MPDHKSGISQAGVVFEALAEGGITRFVTLFQSNSSALSVGPVRSARPYFVSWMLGFDAAYAHVGGSPEALSDISSWGVKNMDEFANGGSYQRITSRQAPHNVYYNSRQSLPTEQTKGYTSSTFTSWPRKKDQPLKTPTANNVNITLSSSLYNVSYTYNKQFNTYNRNVGGTPEVDADNNKQVSPNVVIAIVVPESQDHLMPAVPIILNIKLLVVVRPTYSKTVVKLPASGQRVLITPTYLLRLLMVRLYP
ncbi:MAG: DUF3048 domain-containing protein [Candidatus Saccharibacteria bacterium]